MEDAILGIIYLSAFVLLIYMFLSTRRTVVIASVDPEPSWWPWRVTEYNWWPYWLGGGGNYGSRVSQRTGHRGEHQTKRPAVHYERPWGGASHYANGGAPSNDRGGHGVNGGHGGHGVNSGQAAPSGGHR